MQERPIHHTHRQIPLQGRNTAPKSGSSWPRRHHHTVEGKAEKQLDNSNWAIKWTPDAPASWRREKFYFKKFLLTRQVVCRSEVEYDKWREHVEELKVSLAKYGQLDPIFVKEYKDHTRVHPGVSRMTAADELGWTWLWAEISDRR